MTALEERERAVEGRGAIVLRARNHAGRKHRGSGLRGRCVQRTRRKDLAYGQGMASVSEFGAMAPTPAVFIHSSLSPAEFS
jgi:hypothetical protein